MSVTRVLERLEHLGDSEVDRALRPPVTDPAAAGDDRARRDHGTRPGRDRPARRGWRRPVLLAAAIVAALAVVVGWLVGFSPVLGARHVEVSGTTVLSAAQVEQAAAIPSGTPLLRLDAAAVVSRLEALPEVASAQVHTVYPATVRIIVVERSAVAYLTSPARLIDGTGRPYLTVPTPPTGLPAVSAATTRLADAAEVAASLPPRTRALVASIGVDSDGPVTVKLADGRTVAWGDSSRSGEKAELLTALIAPAGGQPPSVPGTTIDLADPDVVTTR